MQRVQDVWFSGGLPIRNNQWWPTPRVFLIAARGDCCPPKPSSCASALRYKASRLKSSHSEDMFDVQHAGKHAGQHAGPSNVVALMENSEQVQVELRRLRAGLWVIWQKRLADSARRTEEELLVALNNASAGLPHMRRKGSRVSLRTEERRLGRRPHVSPKDDPWGGTIDKWGLPLVAPNVLGWLSGNESIARPNPLPGTSLPAAAGVRPATRLSSEQQFNSTTACSATSSCSPLPSTWNPWFEVNGAPAVHVLGSRFSLGQGNMTALVAARLRLFRALCLPTVKAQMSQHFAWLIWVDRTLQAWAVRELTELIRPMRNARIVFTSAASEFKWSPIQQLRHHGEWAPPPSVEAGRHKLIQFSTRLDADDGLPAESMRDILHQLLNSMRKKPKRMPWFTCWESYLSWQPSAVGEHPFGVLRSEAQTFCVSAGLSKITLNPNDPSVYAHRHAFAKGKSGKRQVRQQTGTATDRYGKRQVRQETGRSMGHRRTS